MQPYVERVVLVYHNLGNWSDYYYPLTGYTYLAPVLGLLVYDAANLSAVGLPELNIVAPESPISVSFGNVRAVPTGSAAPRCVVFDFEWRAAVPGPGGNQCVLDVSPRAHLNSGELQ